MKPSPGALTVNENPTGGQAVLAVLRTGRAGAQQPNDGRQVAFTTSGTINLGRLRPATTYTVTLFARSWTGTLSAGVSATARTPKLPGSETHLTIRDQSGRWTASVLVVRADTQKAAAGRHVTLLIRGHDQVARLTTGRNGRATVTIPKAVVNYAIQARTTGDRHLGGSVDTAP